MLLNGTFYSNFCVGKVYLKILNKSLKIIIKESNCFIIKKIIIIKFWIYNAKHIAVNCINELEFGNLLVVYRMITIFMMNLVIFYTMTGING